MQTNDTLLNGLLLAGIIAAGLLLPGAVVDLAFGTDLLSILAQAVLAAFAFAIIVSVWTAQRR